MSSDPILYVLAAETALDAEVAWVTGLSCGEATLTISFSCTCRVRVRPTPQYTHAVVSLCADSSQVPAVRMSNSDLKESTPVGHTSMQLPQYTHAESVSGAP
jgi:hypothetical protein